MFNDVAIMVAMAIVLYLFFYLRQEVLWGIVLAIFMVLFMAYVNLSNKDKINKKS
jgi:Ca2+/Na+ antiporter